ncbi:hypothetical protein LWI28_019577 [Acer negundo]|uniref:Uncharacterized protein n=1 Tax=Acer negundo TaxID=4023 RepID=A0AAD5I7G8_ACENE|nr:hypothetical protein LWI28_019577 [Acer negundo]
MSLEGILSGDIGGLTELTSLDFSFNKGLTGSLSPRLGDLQKLNVLILAGCSFTGNIPDELGNLADLSFLALNSNNFSGRIPTSLGKLSKLYWLDLADNQLTGSIPVSTSTSPGLDLLKNAKHFDLSNNSFDPSEAPIWFSTLPSLTVLVMEYGSLQGRVPEKLFSFSQIQQVKLRNNMFNGSLSFGDSFSSQLQLVDLENNKITSVTLSSSYTNTLILVGNPVCAALPNTSYCQPQQQSTKPYSTSLVQCGGKSCPADQKMSPQNCECAYPYKGTMYFRAPSFRDLSNVTFFHSLEMSLWVQMNLTPGSVFLQNPFFNADDYLQVQLALFPSPRKNFNDSEVESIGMELSKQTYKPPKEFGPYYFIASPYVFH